VPKIVVVAFDPGVMTGWCRICVDKAALPLGTRTFLKTTYAEDPVELTEGVFAAPGSLSAGQFGARGGFTENGQVDEMIRLTRLAWVEEIEDAEKDTFFVVLEDFILRRSEKDRSLLAPVRLNAKFDYAMKDSHVRIMYQSPSDAKNAVTDARLKSWNVYDSTTGEHGRDAQRHAVLALRKYASAAAIRIWAGVGLSR